MKTIYLCGAINGCTDAQCKDWREAVKDSLAGLYEFLDPMRRDFRGREDESVEEIVRGDKEDIRQCDVVLVAADSPSWGTAMEVVIAREFYGKYVVAVCGQERVSPWLRHYCNEIHRDLAAAIAALRAAA